jgi:hypothetical protein
VSEQAAPPDSTTASRKAFSSLATAANASTDSAGFLFFFVGLLALTATDNVLDPNGMSNTVAGIAWSAALRVLH